LNEEYWLPYCIPELADAVDQVFIVEGAVLGRRDCDDDGHSLDRTIEVIEALEKNYPNVKYVTRDERWKDLEDLKNFLISLVPDDSWVVINDADEIYKSTDILHLRRHADDHPALLEYLPLFLHFYRDFSHILRPGGGTDPVNVTHQRIFFKQQGDYYHYHPTVRDRWHHDKFFFPPYQPRRIFVKGMYIYHFGYCKGAENYLEKHRWYSENLIDFIRMSPEKIKQIMNHPYVIGNDNASDILKFSGNYPDSLYTHPMMDFDSPHFEGMEFDDWKSCDVYDKIIWPYQMAWSKNGKMDFEGAPFIEIQ